MLLQVEPPRIQAAEQRAQKVGRHPILASISRHASNIVHPHPHTCLLVKSTEPALCLKEKHMTLIKDCGGRGHADLRQ